MEAVAFVACQCGSTQVSRICQESMVAWERSVDKQRGAGRMASFTVRFGLSMAPNTRSEPGASLCESGV